ncbi:CENP-B protein, partial [Didymella exigua CBS 183.55]
PELVQPGDREWVTLIKGICAKGWSIPPFIIFSGKHHLSACYKEPSIPDNWVLNVSDNGWTNNKLGVKWLKHFDEHTKARTVGSYWLLILDGHESYNSVEFHQYCEEHRIITLCMPPHLSHLLQPLDVGCFSLLKKAYGRQAERLMRSKITRITKLEFLPCFKAAFDASITESNI